MSKSVHRRVRAAVVGTCLAAAAACTDANPAPPTTLAPTTVETVPTSATAETIPGPPTRPEIVIGALFDSTGPRAGVYGRASSVMEAWAKWANAAAGGVDGHTVRVVWSDTRGDAKTAVAAVKSLVENDHVLALVGSSDGMETSWMKAAVASGTAVVGGTCYDPAACRLPGFYPAATGSPAVVQMQASAARSIKATKVGAVVCSELPACSGSEPILRSAVEAGGLAYGGLVKVGAVDKSYATACSKLSKAGDDFVQLSVAATVVARLVSDCAAKGYRPTFGLAGGSVSAVQLATIDRSAVVAGGLQGFPWWVDDAPVVRFRGAMATYAPGLDYSDPVATSVWASLELFRVAMRDSPEVPVPADVHRGLQALSGENLGGLLPQEMSYSAGVPPVVACFFLYERREGALRAVPGGLTPTCAGGAV